MNANTALVDLVQSMKKEMEERMTRIENKVDFVVHRFEQRITLLEAYVNEQATYMRTYEENEQAQESRETEGDGMNGGKEGEKEGDGITTEGGESVQIEEEPVEDASVDAIPAPKPRLKRTKMKARKRTPEQWQRDEINKRLKEAANAKRQKVEEPTRMSTRQRPETSKK